MLHNAISHLPVLTAMLHILTCSLVETVEVKLEVNVAKSIDNTFSQEIGDRFESPAPLLKRCLAFLQPFDIRYSDKQRKTQCEISDILDELSRCYARDIVYVATTMDGKDRNFRHSSTYNRRFENTCTLNSGFTNKTTKWRSICKGLRRDFGDKLWTFKGRCRLQ